MYASRVAQRCPPALVAVLSLSPAIAAQSVDPDPSGSVLIAGYVIDRTTEQPIARAAVTLVDLDGDGEPVWSGSTDSTGFFAADRVPVGSYELSVDVIPFSRLTHLLVLAQDGVVDLRVEMVTVDYELPPIVVAVRRVIKLESSGFYDRRGEGRGTFLTRDEIAERSPSRVSELFLTIPGARILQGAFGEGNSIRLRGSCTPVYVLDGIVLSGSVVIDDLLPVGGIEGIEVYHGAAAPMQYVGMTSCGAVMLWSRDTGSVSGVSQSTWRTVLGIAVGVGALAALLVR